MRVDVIPIKELTEQMKLDWLKIQASNPCLAGPFFHPELFITVGQYCPDIYVALLYKNNDLAGFLPFQRNQDLSAAQSMRFCNYEAIISSPELEWDMNLLLKNMRLKAWNYQALVNFQKINFTVGEYQVRNSFQIDLSCGLEKYWDFILAKKVGLREEKRRKLEANKGPLRFVANSDLTPINKAICM